MSSRHSTISVAFMETDRAPDAIRYPRSDSAERVGVGIPGAQAMNDAERRRLFGEVFMPHLLQAYRLARWLTADAADADDVVQEASLRAFRGISGFGGINARAWTLTVVRNTAYSWLLKNRPTAVTFTDDLDPGEQAGLERSIDQDTNTNPEAFLVARAQAEEVRGAIAALPAPFREVIVLRELHELNYREIAQITGAPMGTVMSRLARARRMLIAALRSKT